MKERSHKHLFESKVQLKLFSTFWLFYLIINIIATQFFKDLQFQKELLIQSFFYSVGGFIFSFTGYWIIKRIRFKIRSNVFILFLSALIVYAAAFIWAVSHHLSWWIISGDGALVVEFDVYPVKALLFSAILLASILLLILTEKKLLSVLNTDTNNNFNISNVHKIFEVKETDYEGSILLPAKNEVLKINIDSIKLIQANDYYSNIVTKTYDKAILSKYPLKKWELILPKKHFLRIHRSSIVNLNYIEKIEKMDNNTYEVNIRGIKQNVIMSRRCAKTILDKFQL